MLPEQILEDAYPFLTGSERDLVFLILEQKKIYEFQIGEFGPVKVRVGGRNRALDCFPFRLWFFRALCDGIPFGEFGPISCLQATWSENAG